ncbi:BnaC05g09990D [Brassica napus]|uniref:BnaC05g09990D protein n=1 Tax=Brassica napus TaxID=3708 RepID=A0A078HHZ0_BRANA|nr:BnaC05g09990D [Brassica napus]
MLKTQANDVVDTLENGSHVLEKEHGSDVAANTKSQFIRYQVIAQHVKR